METKKTHPSNKDVTRTASPPPEPSPGSRHGKGWGKRKMGLVGIVFLAAYLILGALLLVYLMIALWPDGEANEVSSLWGITLSAEKRLILLVVIAGALGSYVHAATSFVDYVGNRAITLSWTWWYLLRPFIGMALALIFYVVIRGGFFSSGANTTQYVNEFGVIAIAALAGLFSKQATDKLREVFDTLFRTEGKEAYKREDSLEEDEIAGAKDTTNSD